MKLEQPVIMCEGRKRVVCYYRGKITKISTYDDGSGYKKVEFKSYGNKIQVEFVEGICVTKGWQDLKIISEGS
ncbi:MAG TPA: hypothetical protein VFV86_06415 [Nitrososphaeraceae archaeon]|nr:hypothetical protein [Nitrososphaeraceae archaeon]